MNDDAGRAPGMPESLDVEPAHGAGGVRPADEGVSEPASDELVIRPMTRDDVEAVLAIERRQFTSPWQADTFHGLLDRLGAELWVMDHREGGVIAYAVLWCILDQGELANVAVKPEYAGRGYARELLEAMFDLAEERGIATIYLEVRASNQRAADLYRSFGFEEIGRRRRYYEKPKEDALVMRMVV